MIQRKGAKMLRRKGKKTIKLCTFALNLLRSPKQRIMGQEFAGILESEFTGF
jgi:hypothetical protein